MGTIKQGILGGFSGKVGAVIGASWKGINYMRSIPQHVKNPRTEGQVSQRSKFALALNFLKPVTGFLRTGWKLYAHRQSPFNAAMSYTLANAITGTYPDYAIDPSKVLVSRGGLAPAANASATPAGAGTITFDWEDNSGVGNAKQTDKALLAVINPVLTFLCKKSFFTEESQEKQCRCKAHRCCDDVQNFANKTLLQFER
jgi:hypothetical protein